MNGERKRVALIYGGSGHEHDVSVMSAKYVRSLIDTEGYELLDVFIDRDGKWYLNSDGPRVELTLGRGRLLTPELSVVTADVALPLLHGDEGEDGCIAGVLRALGIRFVGCDVTAGAVCYDKALTKLIAERLGIPTAPWILKIEPDPENPNLRDAACTAEKIGYPMFIKPSGLGSSIGAHAVMTPDRFDAAYADACIKGNGRVLIEEYIGDKREIECAFFSAMGRRMIAPPGEVVCHGPYTYEEKYTKASHSTVKACIEDLPAALSKLAVRYSEMLSDALGLRHLSRIDFFLTDKGLLLNEINTMPGFTSGSLYPLMMEAAGIPPRELVCSLIEDALL